MQDTVKDYIQLEIDSLVEDFKLLLFKIRDDKLLDKLTLGDMESIEYFCELVEYLGEQSTYILDSIKRHKEN